MSEFWVKALERLDSQKPQAPEEVVKKPSTASSKM